MPNGLALRRSDPGGIPRRPSNVSVSVQTKLSVHQLNVLGVEQSGLPRFRIADPEAQTGLMTLAQNDARALLATDESLSSLRGDAARTLLYLMEHEQSIRMLSIA